MTEQEESAVSAALSVTESFAKPPTITLQVAYIEWKVGGGGDAAMEWVASYLEDNDLVPPLDRSAEDFFDGATTILGLNREGESK